MPIRIRITTSAKTDIHVYNERLDKNNNVALFLTRQPVFTSYLL